MAEFRQVTAGPTVASPSVSDADQTGVRTALKLTRALSSFHIAIGPKPTRADIMNALVEVLTASRRRRMN
jgi:hypothetical protein